MAEYKNIVGTGFPPEIQKQIEKREAIANSQTRDNNTLQHLTNKNAWVRLSSGVQTLPEIPLTSATPEIGLTNVNVIETGTINPTISLNSKSKDPKVITSRRLRDYSNIIKGNDELSKANVLQGGTFSSKGNIKKGFNETYTQGATDNLGFKPMPGITNVSITTGGKWQTLLQADIDFVCYDLDQLETMSKLYMSLGCTVFLEWGHTNYFKNDNTFEINPQPLNFFNENNKESLRKNVTKKVINTEGNYESIVGTVYNFSYSSNSDGSYNCKTHIMGAGGLVESLKINNSANYTFDLYSAKEEESDKFSSILENALYSLKKFISLFGEPTTIQPPTSGNSNGKNINKLLEVNLKSSIIGSKGNFALDNLESYSSLLNRIFQLPNYKGPLFTPSPFSSNFNVVYGNPWSFLSGHTEGTADLVIPESFYYGYKSPAVIGEKTSDNSSSTYITLGHLMALIQHLGIFTEGSGDKLKPVVYIDYNPENTIVKTGIIQASTDPGKCLVPYKQSIPFGQDNFYLPLNVNEKAGDNGVVWWYVKGPNDYNLLGGAKEENAVNILQEKTKSLSYDGKLFNILINLDFAINTLKNLSSNNEDKNVNLVEYIDAILNGINISLGKVNSLRTFYDDRSNCIRIIDENYQKKEITTEQILKLENFGTKSTVYDFSFSSKITPKLAAQIVISAQATGAGGIKEFSEDVLSYQKLNGNIIDKFALSKKPPIPPQTNSNKENGQSEIPQLKLLQHIYQVYSLQSIKEGAISNLTTFYADQLSQVDKRVNGSPTLLIPLEYSLTMDGISGILPYTIFRIPDSRLPKRYKGKVDFVVFSINHSIENNKWYTTLRGQTLIRN